MDATTIKWIESEINSLKKDCKDIDAKLLGKVESINKQLSSVIEFVNNYQKQTKERERTSELENLANERTMAEVEKIKKEQAEMLGEKETVINQMKEQLSAISEKDETINSLTVQMDKMKKEIEKLTDKKNAGL